MRTFVGLTSSVVRHAARPAWLGLIVAAALGSALGNCGGRSGSSVPAGGLNCPNAAASTCTQAQLNQYSDCIFARC